MNPVSFDTETDLIRPALLAPPMVCLTWQRPGLEPHIDHVNAEAKLRLKTWLTDPETLLVGHFAAYDMAVVCAQWPHLIPLVFAAYRAGRVTCTKKRQQLLDIAGGVFRGRIGEKGRWIVHEYTLEALSRRHRGKPMQKDGWRLEYGNFKDVPLERWPERARELQERARVRRAEISEGHLEGTSKEIDIEVKNLDALIADVPEGCIRYPLEDATATIEIWQAQEKHAAYLKDQYRQAYADFVLYLSSAWGLRTHADGVSALKGELEEAYSEISGGLQALGLVREDGTRDMKAVKRLMIDTCRANGVPVRFTLAHYKNTFGDGKDQPCPDGEACEEHISLDSDACEAAIAGSGEVDGHGQSLEGLLGTPLARYAEFVSLGKMLSNDVKMLEAGTVLPVHTRYDIAETGRTTSSKPNIQNLNTGRHKEGDIRTSKRLRPGVRQAFVPRPGKVFIQADYPQLELYTLAQCCFSWCGYSKLGEAINAGLDPHLAMAATILGISYDEAKANKKRHDVDHARQTAKVANFGFPGGLGPAKLILFARKAYEVILTVEQAKALKEQWFGTWPEMRDYFGRVNALFGEDVERASVETLFTERHRGGATYCAACNNGFQALGADCAKTAICLVAEAEYCNETSALYGSRTVAFVHDEIIAETDDGPAVHDAAFELARLMVEGANRYLKDVPMRMDRMEPTAMRAWSKEAKQVFKDGRLVPWAP